MALQDGICPRCGQRDVYWHHLNALGIPLGTFRVGKVVGYLCRACGHLEYGVHPEDLAKMQAHLTDGDWQPLAAPPGS